MAGDPPTGCVLCGRDRPMTFHHLIPRRNHGNKWFKKRFTREQMNAGIDVCRDCHSAIHKFIDHKTLGRDYATLDALRAHPELSRFVQWVGKRNSAGRVRTARPNA